MVSEDSQYPTLLVGQNSSLLEGIARLLHDTAFRVIARASSVDRLVASDLQQGGAVLLILDASGDLEAVIRQAKTFKQLHSEARIVVVTSTVLHIPDASPLFEVGVNACLGVATLPTVFMKSLELVMLGLGQGSTEQT
jgi:DNA-binding NarL/FixJ family response regulator